MSRPGDRFKRPAPTRAVPRDRHQPDHRSWPAAAPKLSTRAEDGAVRDADVDIVDEREVDVAEEEVIADIDVASESGVERWEQYGAFSDRGIFTRRDPIAKPEVLRNR